MKKFQSLKSKFSFIISIVLIATFVMQTAFLFYISNLMDNKNRTVLNNISYQVSANVKEKLQTLKKMQSGLSSNRFANNYLLMEDEDERKKYSVRISNYISEIQNFNTDIVYMMLFDQKTNDSVFSNNLFDNEKAKIKELFLSYYISSYYHWDNYYDFFNLEMNSFMQTYIVCFAPVYEYDYDEMKNSRIGTSVVCSKINVESLVNNMENWSNMSLRLEDGQNSIVLLQNRNNMSNRILENDIIIDDTKWRICVDFDANDMNSIYDIIKYIIFAETLALLILMIIIHHIIKKNITKPITKITSYLDGYFLNDNKHEKLEINQNTDIGVISHHINTMIVKNKKIARKMISTQQRLYETELVKNTAALYALQNQVNPHFIYNSLECIRSIACVYDVKEIEVMANAISNIMRYTLEEEKFVTIQDEVDILTEYFKIMNIRFGNKFTYSMSIDKNICSYKMPRMILQPIIENSFNHGLIQSGQIGVIDIKGYEKNGVIEFIVRDNGVGIKSEKLEEIRNNIRKQAGRWTGKKSGIGLVNIDNRIKMYFNKNYGININSVENEYTEVVIRFAKL